MSGTSPAQRAEETLRESEERYRLLFEHIADAVFSTDLDCCIRSWNPAAEKLYGWKADEVIGRPADDIVRPQYVSQPLEQVVQTLRETGEWRGEVIHHRRDGTAFPVLSSAAQIKNATGKRIGCVAINHDLTERKQSEAALRNCEVVRRQALESSPDAVFAIDRAYCLLFNNQRHQQVLADSGGHPFQAGENVLSPAYPPEVRDYWRAAYDRALRGELFMLETKWTNRQGQNQVFENFFSPLRDAGAAIIGVLVVARDITARKQSEQALREREELHQRLFEAESDAIFLVDCETGRFREANPSAGRMYGYSREELLTLKVADISAEPEKSLEAIQGEETLVALRRHRRRDGTVFPVEIAGGYLQWSGRRLHVAAIRDITERKRAEAMLKESEQRLQMALDAAECGSFDYDFLTGSIKWSERQKRIWGLAPGEIPTYAGTLARIHPEDQERIKQLVADVTAPASNGIYETEYRIVWPDGSIHWNSVNGRVFFEGEGKNRKPIRWLGVERDLTGRKQAEAALAADLKAMSCLQNLASVFVQHNNLAEALMEVVDAAIAIAEADFGTIQLLDPATGDLRIMAQRGFPPWWCEYWDSVAKGQGVCGTALERGERVIVEDVECSPIFGKSRALDIQRKAGVRAVQSTPLICRSGKVVGIFSTHCKIPRRPDDRTLRLLDLLARQTSGLIEHAQAQAALRESEQRFAAVIRNSPVAIGISRLADGTFLEVNEAFVHLYGYTREEIVGRTSQQLGLWHSENRDSVIRNLREQRGRQIVEMHARRKDGEIRCLLASIDRIELDGELCMVGFLSDITERKRTEEALQLQSAIVATMAEGVCLVQAAEQKIVYANPRFERMFGYGPGEMSGLPVKLLNYEADAGDAAAVAREVITQLERTGEATREVRNVRKDGTPFWCEAHVSTLNHPELGRVWIAVHQDITSRKQAEAERADAVARLAAIQEEERLRISRELHDQTAQRLVALSVELKNLETTLNAGRPHGPQMRFLRQTVDDLQQQVRQVAWGLRTGEFRQGSWADALRDYVEEWSERARVSVDWECRGLDGPPLPELAGTTVYRVVQEALTNVERHAHARRVSVMLERTKGLLRLTVEDDGRGFDAQTNQALLEPGHRLGLLGMKERVLQAGGTLLIESAPESGTTILVRIPVPTEGKP